MTQKSDHPSGHPSVHPSGQPTGQPTGIPARGTQAPLSPAGLKLPHERDQSMQVTAPKPDPKMLQAKRDLDAGLVDTDMRVTPGQDAQRREQLVPGPGGKPLSSRG
jgi:hypothetical protein